MTAIHVNVLKPYNEPNTKFPTNRNNPLIVKKIGQLLVNPTINCSPMDTNNTIAKIYCNSILVHFHYCVEILIPIFFCDIQN